MRKLVLSAIVLSMVGMSLPGMAVAQQLDPATEARIRRLEAINEALLDYIKSKSTDAESAALARRVQQLEEANPPVMQAGAPAVAPSGYAVAASAPVSAASGQVQSASGNRTVAAAAPSNGIDSAIGLNSEYSFRMLDHAEGVNTRQLTLLQARRNHELTSTLTLGGGITAIADWQNSNRDSKFAYLMRHPTSANQIGNTVSEAVIHSMQLQTTFLLSDEFSGFAELLYNPEQSFGSGTITDLNRNQIQLRRGFLLWGNLDKYPFYASIGKMDVPFGVNDTVSPFTNSSNWHAFAGLAYGAELGYYADGIHVRGMAVQGGSQFRAANASVQDTNVPSKLNNFALDANYTARLDEDATFKFGGSYLHGSPYCQAYPVTHFSACTSDNPAWAAYGELNYGRLKLAGEIARTFKAWEGTKVPAGNPGGPANPLTAYEASKVTAFTLGARYAAPIVPKDLDISFEFSQFRAGPGGSPWERQNQWVFGLSNRILPSVDIFGEYIFTQGYTPLNFISGGNFADGSTWSDRDAESNVILFGIQAAF